MGSTISRDLMLFMSKLGEIGVENISVVPILTGFSFVEEELDTTRFFEYSKGVLDLAFVLRCSSSFVLRIRNGEEIGTGRYIRVYIDRNSREFIQELLDRGVKLELQNSVDSLSRLLSVAGLKRGCKYTSEVSKAVGGAKEIDIWMVGGEHGSSLAVTLSLKSMQEYLEDASREADRASIELVALKYNGNLVGYRFLEGNDKYDIDINCARALGVHRFKVGKQLKLELVGGVLRSSSEVTSKKLVRDISDDKDAVKSLFSRLEGCI